MNSYGGRILRVDLSKEEISFQETKAYADRWIGGRAINTWICLDEMAPEVEWNSPESLLCFGVGVLAGTLAPGA